MSRRRGCEPQKKKKLPKTLKGLSPPDMSDDENFEIISRLNNINHFFVRANVVVYNVFILIY